MNAIGALVTAIVLIVVASHQGTRGRLDHHAADPDPRRSSSRRRASTTTPWRSNSRCAASRPELRKRRNTVLVPISGLQRAVVEAVNYARSLSQDVRALYVDVDPVATEQLKREWDKWGDGVPLVVLQSPYRSLMEPLLEYIEQVDRESPDDYVTVVLPGVRARALVAPPVPQPAGAADQRRAAVPPQYRRHQRAVPSQPLSAWLGIKSLRT